MNEYNALEWLFFICFLCIIAVIGTNYFLGIKLTTVLKDLFTKPEIHTSILQTGDHPNPSPPPGPPKPGPPPGPPKPGPPKPSNKHESYHINGNYDYSNAKAVCKAYDGKLATLDQIKQAFQKGAEWCDYGWSDDSMVLYPTQEESWKEYQNTDDPQQCGIPGINGGYNKHINQRLGANCYGIKPPGTMPLYPSPVIVEKTHPNLSVSPFNYKRWFQ